jgi:hypothetical protein
MGADVAHWQFSDHRNIQHDTLKILLHVNVLAPVECRLPV